VASRSRNRGLTLAVLLLAFASQSAAAPAAPVQAARACSGTAYGGFYRNLSVRHVSCKLGRRVMRRWHERTYGTSARRRRILGFDCRMTLRDPAGPDNTYAVIKCRKKGHRLVRFEGHS
jgi:hypothetical protein